MSLRRPLAWIFLLALCAAGAPTLAREGGRSTDTLNPHHPRYGHPYRHGAVPTREAHAKIKEWAQANSQMRRAAKGGVTYLERPAIDATTAAATGADTLSFMGGIGGVGVTSGAPKVYVVFWGSQWGAQSTDASGYSHFSGDPANAAPYIQGWLRGLGTNGELWSGVMTQYCDGPLVASGSTACPSGAARVPYPAAGSVLAGVWYDNATASPSQATGAQIANEAIRAAAHFGNTSAAANRYAQYIVVSPTGTHPDGFNTSTGNFCAWHDFTGDTTLAGGPVSSPYGNIAFTNMPYVTDMGASCGQSFVSGPLDGFSMVGGHEYAETLTDQFPAGGWINHTGSANNGYENADECAWISSGQGAAARITLSTGTYVMQSSWSNDTNRCDLTHAVLASGGGQPSAGFTYSASGLAVAFTDTSTDSGGAIGSHSWTFGDGGTSTAANPSHTYAAAGSYAVTETVGDSTSGLTSSKTATVTVSAGGGTPLANFGVSTSGLTATFSDSSTDSGGTIGSHSWSFGDGSTSTAANPSHTYAAGGTYSVTETVTDSVSGASSTKTASLTVSAATQLISNSGFETGSASPWTMTAGVLCSTASCSGENPYAGAWYAWLDGYGTSHTDTLAQAVALPAGRTATLSFYLHIDTHETGTYPYDTLRVQVVNASGTVLATLATYSNANAAPGYALKTMSLSTYAGQTVSVRFVGTEDASLATSFLIDNVTVNVQ